MKICPSVKYLSTQHQNVFTLIIDIEKGFIFHQLVLKLIYHRRCLTKMERLHYISLAERFHRICHHPQCHFNEFHKASIW